MNFISHIPKFIELATKVISGLQVTYEIFDGLRNEFLDWKNNRRRTLQVSAKDQGAVAVLEDFLKTHPNFNKVVSNKEVPTKRLLSQFQVNDTSNPFKEEPDNSNPFRDDDSKVTTVPSRVKSGYSTSDQSYRNGKVYLASSNKAVNLGPAGAFYKLNGPVSTLSHTPIDESRIADLTLAELKESLWLRNALHSSDAMYVAQMFPGEKVVPYYDGENLPKLGAGVLQVTDTFGTSVNNWTVMCWSPTIGALYGGDGYWDAQGSDAAFAVNTTTTATVSWSVQKPGSSAPTNGITAAGFSYLYTASSPFSNNVYPWAAELSVTVEAPSAIVGGTVYRALVPASQFFNGVSFKSLLTIAQREPVEHGRTYAIRTSVQNRALVHHVAWTGSSSSVANAPVQDELVAVMMIHNPAVSLTGGTPASYDLVQKVKINYAYAPLYSNPWTASMTVDDSSLDYKELLPRRFKELAKGGETLNPDGRVGSSRPTMLEPGSNGGSPPSSQFLLNTPALRAYAWSPNEANEFLAKLKTVLRDYDLPPKMVEAYARLRTEADVYSAVVAQYLSGDSPDPEPNKRVNESFHNLLLRRT